LQTSEAVIEQNKGVHYTEELRLHSYRDKSCAPVLALLTRRYTSGRVFASTSATALFYGSWLALISSSWRFGITPAQPVFCEDVCESA